MELGVVDPIIGLDVPSDNSPINSEMVEVTPISNTNPQVPRHSDNSEGSFLRSHEWDKLITDEKSIMELILNRCDETTREEINLGQSPEYDVMTGGFLKFIKQLRKVCTHSKSKNILFGSSISKFTKHHIWPVSKSKNVFFGLSISKFTKHHIRPASRVENLLATHPDNDCIWNNTDPCDVSLDNTSNSKGRVNSTTTPTSIKIENNSNAIQDSVATTKTIMMEENDKTWYNTNEEYN